MLPTSAVGAGSVRATLLADGNWFLPVFIPHGQQVLPVGYLLLIDENVRIFHAIGVSDEVGAEVAAVGLLDTALEGHRVGTGSNLSVRQLGTGVRRFSYGSGIDDAAVDHLAAADRFC